MSGNVANVASTKTTESEDLANVRLDQTSAWETAESTLDWYFLGPHADTRLANIVPSAQGWYAYGVLNGDTFKWLYKTLPCEKHWSWAERPSEEEIKQFY